jgi:putative inorganic carbon (HCO3(-)) transporter
MDYPRSDSTRGCFAGFLILLFCAPLPLGSNRPWAWEPLAILIFLLAIAWLLAYLLGKAEISPVLRAAWPMLACAALWLAWVWLQLLPLPLSLLEWLSPQAAHWHAAATFLGTPEAAPISLDRQAGFNGALKSTAYLVFFVLTLLLLDSRERIGIAATTLIVSGFTQAMVGGLGALGTLQSLGIESGPAHGTFVNRNHYAAYLVMCLSVGIGMLIANLSGGRSETLRQFVRDVAEWILSPKMRLRLALVIMVTALVLTRSRGGNSSFFAALVIAGTIGLLLSRRATRSTVILLASLIAIDIFIIGAYFGVEQVVHRLEETTEESEDRDEVAGYAFAMWKDYPIFGAGLGSFANVFPRYSGIGTLVAYTHAHNDYLQFLAETGVVGFTLLGLMVLMSFIAALRAQYLREDPVMRGISFAALMGIIALMIHSALDFSLQIPANALTFMVLLAFGWIALYQGRIDDDDETVSGDRVSG